MSVNSSNISILTGEMNAIQNGGLVTEIKCVDKTNRLEIKPKWYHLNNHSIVIE